MELSEEEANQIKKQLAANSDKMSGLEQTKAQQKKNGTDLLDTEATRRELKEALLGKREMWHQDKQKYVEKDKGNKQLINREGFDTIWSLVRSYLNEIMESGYMPRKKVERLVLGTMEPIVRITAFERDQYDIDNKKDAMAINRIILGPILANTSKSIGGKGLKTQTETVVKRLTGFIGDEKPEEENKSISLFG